MDRAALKCFRRHLKSLMLIFQVETMPSLLSLLICGEGGRKKKKKHVSTSSLCPLLVEPNKFKTECITVIAI